MRPLGARPLRLLLLLGCLGRASMGLTAHYPDPLLPWAPTALTLDHLPPCHCARHPVAPTYTRMALFLDSQQGSAVPQPPITHRFTWVVGGKTRLAQMPATQFQNGYSHCINKIHKVRGSVSGALR